MSRALELAALAADNGDIPVGCVIVRDGIIIGEGYNCRERDGSALGHAEIVAIERACHAVGSWRLGGCEMYVTLEPCPMCAGAVINARLDAVHFALEDPKAGACGSVIDLFYERFNHRPRVTKGLMARESSALIKYFFDRLRGMNGENL